MTTYAVSKNIPSFRHDPRHTASCLVIHNPRSLVSQKIHDTILPPLATSFCAPTLHLSLLRTTSAGALPGLLDNSLVAVSVVPLLAVGQEPVDDDATDGEDEDKDRPKELVADGAGRLEDLDWVGKLAFCISLRVYLQDLLQTRMSSTRTIKPITPPPAPY